MPAKPIFIDHDDNKSGHIQDRGDNDTMIMMMMLVLVLVMMMMMMMMIMIMITTIVVLPNPCKVSTTRLYPCI
jgi:hypothetical protein